jgi:hypothetical protein
VVIPDELQVEDPVWRQMTELLPNVPLERDMPQCELALVFEAIGADFLDLLPVMLAVEPLPDGLRHLYHLRDTHFNARGSRVAGEALAEFLRERL